MTKLAKFTVVLCACGLFAVACGEKQTQTQRPSVATSPDEDQLYSTVGLVLDTHKNRPPLLCLGAVMESDPPQCYEGIPMEKWNWEDVRVGEGKQPYPWGVYGDYELTGRYDGKTFTVVEAGPPPEYEGEEEEAEEDFTSCPEPEGGWESPDPTKVDRDDLVATTQAAEKHPDSAGAWIDGPILNLAFTGDLESHEATARETWGGALCMVEYRYTYEQLRDIPKELDEDFDIESIWSDVDVRENQVEIGAVFVDPSTEAAIAERYGEGTVKIYSRLQPVE